MPTKTTLYPTTYQPFIAVHGDGTDPWFVLWANELIIMNKENRHRMLMLQRLLNMGIITLLVSLAGIASGLTLALFTLDPEKVKSSAATGKGRRSDQARRVLPHLTNPHWTLVTLLVLNAFAVETMPLVLSRLYGGIIAVLLSVVLVLFFGEIFPQAAFTRFALPVCSFFSPFISFSKFVTSPISWPVAKLLDIIIGKREKKFMRRVELQQLIKLHQSEEKAKKHEQRDAAIIEAATATTTNALTSISGGSGSAVGAYDLEMAITPTGGAAAAHTTTTVSAAGAPVNNLSFSRQQHRQIGKQRRRNVKPGPRAQNLTHRNMNELNAEGHGDGDASSSSTSSDSEHLEELEVRIMMGALSMSELTVRQILAKTVDKIFCIAADRKIDKEVVERVFLSGFSRVLVLDEDEMKFIGYFLSRDLVAFAYKSEDNAPLARNLVLHQPIYCSASETIGTLYSKLCLVTTPIVIVTESPASSAADVAALSDHNVDVAVEAAARSSERAKKYKPVGLLTFEDVFETVQGTTISDETDSDNDKAIQLKSKLFAAMVLRRQNQRVAEALTGGMLRRELTEDRFTVALSPPMTLDSSVSARSTEDVPKDKESSFSGATARTGLLARVGSSQNLNASYGSTAAVRSGSVSPSRGSKGILNVGSRSPFPLPRGRKGSRGPETMSSSVNVHTDNSSNPQSGNVSVTASNPPTPGMSAQQAQTDTFLSPRLRAVARYPTPSSRTSPTRRSQ